MREGRKAIRGVRAGWGEIVLVCRKCSKKLDGGFGPRGDERLAKVLRRDLMPPIEGSGSKGSKGRKARLAVIEVGCLDVCPKGAVVAIRAAAPDQWLVVPSGAGTGEIALSLGLSDPERC